MPSVKEGAGSRRGRRGPGSEDVPHLRVASSEDLEDNGMYDNSPRRRGHYERAVDKEGKVGGCRTC